MPNPDSSIKQSGIYNLEADINSASSECLATASRIATRRTEAEKRQVFHDVLLRDTGLDIGAIYRNASIPVLYELALKHEPGTALASSGALITLSGKKTGRSPQDKRIVKEPASQDNVWWGPVNTPLTDHVFMINRERAVDYLNTRPRMFVFDGFAGWDSRYRIKIRVVCARAYHALFMQNMLIRPTPEELENFGQPDFTILNAGEFPANRYTEGMTSATSVAISFEHKEMVILGTQYAGEMKKGVFTVMHYLMPLRGVLSLHASANEGMKDNDVTLFFGLSGTGKTTLSADIHRRLIGDDEHCWSDDGIFNIEGGCYAKCVDLSREKEPEIFDAIRFGSVLENVVFNEESRLVDYVDRSITENTRCAYPIEYIPNAKVPCMGGHPKNIVLLTCDAFGVLPPLAKLTREQAMYHFISGYTAKIAGTEMGVTEPTATFSACFGQPFLVWHPMKYASMLADKMTQHKADAWLLNTGWTGGKVGVGQRMSLRHSRALLDAIHAGAFDQISFVSSPIFNLQVPVSCPGVPAEVLDPSKAWRDSKLSFDAALRQLAGLFKKNFQNYSDKATSEVLAAGPNVN